ncbi:MAG: class I SAM-dependent methyltransferase [Planctomycetes bacterium]|nr:class I SAM-dependent methyltransferase [Planctomycetota bacterium]MCB9891928.1 class I SAM-dependent methyltransferase [Planctomycetota bacterium]
MTRQVQSEPHTPSRDALELVELMRQAIHPDEAALEPWVERYGRNHARRIASDLDLVRRHVPDDGELLEVGSVPLLATAALERRGYSIRGVDVAPERFTHAREALGLDVRKCDIEREPLPFETGSFDAVLFFELFEHLRIDPIFTMAEVHRVLKPGGTLLLSTPNLRSLGGIVNFLVHGRAHSCSKGIYDEYRKLRELGHMGHVREYTPVEVQDFLERLGFEVLAVVHRGSYTSAWRRVATRIFPRLRPFLGVVARRIEVR